MTCIYQGTIDRTKIGWGNCKICRPNSKNKDCKGYKAITIQTFEVRRACPKCYLVMSNYGEFFECSCGTRVLNIGGK